VSKEVSPLVAALTAPPPPKSPLQFLRAVVASDPAVGAAIHTARENGRSLPEIAAILTDHLDTEILTSTVKRWVQENS
jgi:hypothetical protein